MKSIILLLTTCLSAFSVFAQTSSSQISSKPNWVMMMDDPNVNYFEAVKAFETYWEKKELPLEEDELFQASEEEKESGKLLHSKKENSDEQESLAFEYKRFKHWQMRIQSFVKEDGHIMNADERIEQWKQQRNQRK